MEENQDAAAAGGRWQLTSVAHRGFQLQGRWCLAMSI
jgi:hypothetical protein